MGKEEHKDTGKEAWKEREPQGGGKDEKTQPRQLNGEYSLKIKIFFALISEKLGDK